MSLKVRDICHGSQVASRAMVMQQKTHRPVQFEITAATRESVLKWIEEAGLRSDDYLFPSRVQESSHIGTRQYARIVVSVRPTHIDVRSPVCSRSALWRPAMWQQIFDAACRVCRQSLQDVLEVGVRIMAIDARRVQQAHDRRPSFTRSQAARE